MFTTDKIILLKSYYTQNTCSARLPGTGKADWNNNNYTENAEFIPNRNKEFAAPKKTSVSISGFGISLKTTYIASQEAEETHERSCHFTSVYNGAKARKSLSHLE